jgi:hypothetical protein
MPFMGIRLNPRSSGPAAPVFGRQFVFVACLLSLSTTGCLSPLARSSRALSNATTPVVEQTAAAYRDAQELHDLRVDFEAVTQFDTKDPVYNPRKIQPLLTDDDIQVRVAVLTAFQTYAHSLVEISEGTESPELDAAAKSVGQNLSGLANSIAPSVQNVSSAAAAVPATTDTDDSATASAGRITPQMQSGIATAANALAEFLVSRKIKKDLPGIIRTMDPHLQALCDLLQKDLDTLHGVETRDYNFLINQQTLFIRSTQLDPQQRREQIMKLPQIVRRQQEADKKILSLKASITRLAETHTTLLASVQNNNPESLKDKLAELEAAGNNLGKFYASLQKQ